MVDSFLATSSRIFTIPDGTQHRFAQRLWISTTNRWSSNATEAIKNQHPPVTRINLSDLAEAPVDWHKLDANIHGSAAQRPKKQPRPHQHDAVSSAISHFQHADRGKLIMACGTGKTFTALRLAEEQTQHAGLVLFLVPSIALLGQTLREWAADATTPIHPICICSDPAITQVKTRAENDDDQTSVVDLAFPASTNVDSIVAQFRQRASHARPGMTVVFSTYQSIDVVANAQQRLRRELPQFGRFDLIICDEAHRTTGVALENNEKTGYDESHFIRIHDDTFIAGAKRVYMTATPRLFTDEAKSKAKEADAILCSMDDEALYGAEMYRIGFGEAVARGLLTDYKVLILTLSESSIPAHMQSLIGTAQHEIPGDDALKLMGCVNALSKQIVGDNGVIAATDPEPMRRAVAFCSSIKASKAITALFDTVSHEYIAGLPDEQRAKMIAIDADHIDGSMNAPQRDQLLSWLKADAAQPECRMLTNVKCLSEGVDVPSLDAVLFLSARNSQVDVVQSVGRVMRTAPGKKYGYIIIPIVVPSDVEPEVALNDNERYKVVWTVLNALRAHDDRFNATINKIELNKNKNIGPVIIGKPYNGDDTGGTRPSTISDPGEPYTIAIPLEFRNLQDAIFARMVQKVGDRRYWEQWAKNVAEIAERQVERITRLVNTNTNHRDVFAKFLKGLQTNINPSISQAQAIEMLSQHIITRPVFEALFEGYSFIANNPVSQAMQHMLDLLEDQAVAGDTATLQKFYESVRMRAAGIDNAEGKQRIIVELYDKFFKTAFPKMVEQLGIVYTPIEVVDFIINSVDDVLQREFGQTLSDEQVHILDPFTGTGTFITRLIQSGRIRPADLVRKYRHEIHANEMVLLAYYIAAVNIENAFHDALPDQPYQAFEGICLTDTFQLGEPNNQLFAELFPHNSARVEAQKQAPLRVIMGNPPYSIGQKSANDNAQNQSYPKLDRTITETYAKSRQANSVKAVYDSYIKAFRWSSDRLDPQRGGIICFVSNGAWLDNNGFDGFRMSLQREFDAIYVFNLRGNQRTSGELSRKEGGKIFGSGSRTPIAITLLVKKGTAHGAKHSQLSTLNSASIYYHDIGDYLNREEKLARIHTFGSMINVPLTELTPNEHGDWISLRNDSFSEYTALAPQTKFDSATQSFFVTNSLGVASGRDSWVYNFSLEKLTTNIESSFAYYNMVLAERQINHNLTIETYIQPTKISWNHELLMALDKQQKLYSNTTAFRMGIYRPYCEQHMYFDNDYNARQYQNKKLFPTATSTNLVICVTGVGASKDFSALITNMVPSLDTLEKSQCFPLYYYEPAPTAQADMFAAPRTGDGLVRRDGISDWILAQARQRYGAAVNKEDIFYYVYGFLHSPDYRTTYANDLKKMLPRLPLVERTDDFWAFSRAGRALAALHVDYEQVPAHPQVVVTGAEHGMFAVEKMRFAAKDRKDTIIYNSAITISNIPAEAYEYVVNGKSAIEWVLERYAITTHKESGIVNDPNDWAAEVGNPRYILDLLLSVIHVSTQTVALVTGLPRVVGEG
jgi:predicted helicase